MFMDVMLEEFNSKFALQLDLSLITNWSSQYDTDTQAENGPCIVLAGSNHSSRLIDSLESTCLTTVDSTVAGFLITDNSVAATAADVEKLAKLDPASMVVLMQLLDNSIYLCKLKS